MDAIKCGASQCGSCRFYTPVGRRGGDCSQLGVPVRANWKACCLAQSPFQPATLKPAVLSPIASYTAELESLWSKAPLLPQPVLSELAAMAEVEKK